MGDEEVHSSGDEHLPSLSSYTLRSYSGRQIPSNYRGFVYSKWLRSLRKGNDLHKLCKSASFYSSYGSYLDRLFRQSDTTIRLAVLTEDPDVVLGFSCTRGTILDYVFVVPECRRQNIGRHLVGSVVGTITNLTREGLAIWGTKFPNVEFDPFA